MVFNGAQWHLLVNHLPVVGFAALIPLLAVAIKLKSLDIKRLVLVLTAASGLCGLASFWTGEPAEHVVKQYRDVDRKQIHAHEEAAEVATVLGVTTALLAIGLFALHLKNPEILRHGLPVIFIFSIITALSMAKTAHDGGKIRHPEIREVSAEGKLEE